ncbi:hypothetical protein LCGC14_1459890, partial [marine sediment metagenome]
LILVDLNHERATRLADANVGEQSRRKKATKNFVLLGLIDVLANQVGRINLNGQCQRGPDTLPFNGRKDSAEGTLSVSDALRVFSIRTTVATKSSERNRDLVTSIVRGRHSRTLTTDYLF